ncbi:MAG: dihydrodipicolinate synthase family protein, partial [Bacteroidales bacterium]|nr:dihydrodipicolinate synthase family protein [Bacteroidales bacterium]
MIQLKGCGTALLTPFTKEGSVDYEAFARTVDRQVEAGIHFLVPLGTTGETPCLSAEERVEILRITKEHSQG